MSNVEHLSDQLDRSFHGGPWHGPAVAEVLEDVDAATAARRWIPDAHSIWEVVLHLTVWNQVPLRRIEGERVGEVAEEVDWADIADESEEAWQAALGRLSAAHHELHQRLQALSDDELDRPVSGAEPTVRGLILGVLQHNAYHAGQIMLLKKAANG